MAQHMYFGITILLIYCSHSVKSTVDQATIEETRYACQYHGHLTLRCPKDYVVIVKTAQYFKSQTRGCNPNEENLCEMESVSSKYRQTCLALDSCDIPLVDPVSVNPCTGYNGDPFLEVKYWCQPYTALNYQDNVRYMCDFQEPIWSGSMLYLWSSNFPSYSNQDDDCGCTVRVERSVEMQMLVPNFEPPAEEREAVTGCSQVMDVQAGNSRESICSTSEDHVNKIDLDVDSVIYVHYRNPTEHHVRFWIVMQVHHDFNFTVQCGKNFQMPSLPPTTQSNTEPIPVNTQLSGQSATDTERLWPIITSVVAVVCVVLVMSVALLLFCRRRHKKRSSGSKADGVRNLVYQNSVFVSSPPSNYSGSNHSSQHQTEVNIEIVSSRDSSSTINIRSSTSSPVPFNTAHDDASAHGKADVPDVPKEVISRLGFRSEATIKQPVVIRQPEVGKGRKVGSGEKKWEKNEVNSTTRNSNEEKVGKPGLKKVEMDLERDRVKDEDQVTPYVSMTDLSVKDLAKLMENQIQANKNSKR